MNATEFNGSPTNAFRFRTHGVNMQLAKRILSMLESDSGAWEPYYRARKMKKDGESVLDLTVGDHDIPTNPAILAEMARSAASGRTGYTVVPGTTELRKAVAARIENRTGVPTGIENVVITSGGQGALLVSHLAILNPGDRALFFDPYYPTYPGTITAAGGTPVPVATRPEHEFRPDAEQLDRLAPGATSLLFNSPNNPTGTIYPPDAIATIAEIALRHDLWIISDEVYDTQVWSGEHFSIRSLEGMRNRTFVIGSMSKSFAMTGSRVGWLAGPAEVIGALGELLTVVTFGVPEYVQDAALYALGRELEFEKGIAAPFRERLGVALDILRNQQCVALVPPKGAMYLMLDIRSTGMTGKEFALHLLDRERIAVMPGESFGQSAAGHVRVAMTVPASDLGDAIRRLVAVAGELAGRRTTARAPAAA